MIDKSSASLTEALSQIKDGSTIMIGGFGTAGQPAELIDGLIQLGIKDLTIVSNNAGNGDYGLAKLLKAGAVKKVICSFPRQSDSWVFDELYRAGKIELELVPQGNLACRIQAAGMGLGAVFTPTGYGTLLAEGKETRHIDGKDYVLEYPIKADFALIKAQQGDRWGNLVINPAYDAAMLSAAMCKLEGFAYAPSEALWWQHGHSSERDFIYVTTQTLSAEQLDALAEEVGAERSLLVCCGAYRGVTAAQAAQRWPQLTIKKIPKMVKDRCEWGHDDYSLNVANLPMAAPKPGAAPAQDDLFGEDGA